MRPMTRRTQGTEDAKISTRVDALERRHYGVSGFYEIKLYPDLGHPVAIEDDTLAFVQVGDRQFGWPIPRDVATKVLVEAEAGITQAGSSDVVVEIMNGGVGGTGTVQMLTDPITIDAGDLSSVFSASPSSVDPANDDVDLGEIIWINVTADGGGVAVGLAVYLRFD